MEQIFKYHIKCDSGSFGSDKKFYHCQNELTFETIYEDALPDGWGKDTWSSYDGESSRTFCPSCWLISRLEKCRKEPGNVSWILSDFPRELIDLVRISNAKT